MARAELLAGVLGQAALLGCLDATIGLGGPGWIAGLGWAAAVALAMWWGFSPRWARVRGLPVGAAATVGARGDGLGPANRVTLLRAIVVGAVAALIVDGLPQLPHPLLVGALAVAALALDGADGWVARRSRTSSVLGARFDMEVDAFLILVLSIGAAATYGEWVLAIGAARYALLLAGALAPWLRAPIPPRMWRKAVAALQGAVLVAVVPDVLPVAVELSLLMIGATCLALSFGLQIRWLWLHRQPLDSPRRLSAPRRAIASRAT